MSAHGTKDDSLLQNEQPPGRKDHTRLYDEQPSRASDQTVPVPHTEADDAADAATRAALDVLRERARYWAERAVGPSRNCPK